MQNGIRTIRRLAVASAVTVAMAAGAPGMDPGNPLRLPGFWDRVVVLVVGLILIGGVLVLLNGLRRRADRRESGE